MMSIRTTEIVEVVNVWGHFSQNDNRKKKVIRFIERGQKKKTFSLNKIKNF